MINEFSFWSHRCRLWSFSGTHFSFSGECYKVRLLKTIDTSKFSFLLALFVRCALFFFSFLLAQSPDIFISVSFLALCLSSVWLLLWGSLMDRCVCFQTAGLVKVWWIVVFVCRLLVWSKFDGSLCLFPDCWTGQSLMDHCVRLLVWSKFDGSLCQTAGLVKVWWIIVSDCWTGQSLMDHCVGLLDRSKFDGSLCLFPDCGTWRDRWRRTREVGTVWTAPTLQQPRSSRRGKESWRRKLRSASTKSKECDKNLKTTYRSILTASKSLEIVSVHNYGTVHTKFARHHIDTDIFVIDAHMRVCTHACAHTHAQTGRKDRE